jgi:P-type Cu+ transporter
LRGVLRPGVLPLVLPCRSSHLEGMSDHPATAKSVVDITGMHCSGCASVIEKALDRALGPGRASVNLSLETVEITGPIDLSQVTNAIEAAGYGASPRQGTAQERRLARDRLEAARRAESRQTLLAAIFAALLFLPFLVDMLGLLAGKAHGWLLSPFVQLALASLAQFGPGWRFVKGAVKALRQRAANMDVLVALGTLAAFGFSAWRVLAGHARHEALYFEGAVAIIAFVLFGKVLEQSARVETGDAIAALTRGQPQSVLVLAEGAWREVPVETLRMGQLFAIKPGERAAADGIVQDGVSDMDESLITGETLPQAKSKGAAIRAGALNGTGILTAEATAVGEDATLARIGRQVEAAQASRASVQSLADQVSRLFVPAVLLIAILTAAVWLVLGRSETALVAGISVLVVSCPCALGLATPLALVSGLGAAARAGILIRDASVLEVASAIDLIAFDKTGTLTEGRPRLAAIAAPGVGPDTALALALALALKDSHPLSGAIRESAEDRDIRAESATDIAVAPGLGLEGRVGTVAVKLGTAEYLRGGGLSLGVLEQVILRDPAFSEAATLSWLAADGKVIAALAFVDGLRNHADAVVTSLKADGYEIAMLSGDRRSAAEAMARTLKIETVRAPLKPADKVQALKAFAQEGRNVAMVGDGLNDAPALAAAPVSIALSSGTEAAQAAAGITLMRPDLRLLPRAFRHAHQTRRVIRQNLFLAFLFNGVGIPAAALGLLTPAIAGAAMALSSLAVVLNAWLLSRRGV